MTGKYAEIFFIRCWKEFDQEMTESDLWVIRAQRTEKGKGAT